MIDKKQFVDSLYAYIDFIFWCEERLRKQYQFKGNPYTNQRITGKRGNFDIEGNNFEFYFHGAGLSVNYQRLELHYDLKLSQENYIRIAPWKLMRFIVTYLRLEKEVDLGIIDGFLTELSASGIVIKSEDFHTEYFANIYWYWKFDPTVDTPF